MKIKIPKLSLKNLKELFSFHSKEEYFPQETGIEEINENRKTIKIDKEALDKLRAKISKTMEIPKEYMDYPDPPTLAEIKAKYEWLRKRYDNQEDWGKLYNDKDKRFFDY